MLGKLNPMILRTTKEFSTLTVSGVQYLALSACNIFSDGTRMKYGGALGRHYGKITVDVPANESGSAIDAKLKSKERRLGRKLEYVIESSRSTIEGNTVTSILVYDPAQKPHEAEFARFKPV